MRSVLFLIVLTVAQHAAYAFVVNTSTVGGDTGRAPALAWGVVNTLSVNINVTRVTVLATDGSGLPAPAGASASAWFAPGPLPALPLGPGPLPAPWVLVGSTQAVTGSAGKLSFSPSKLQLAPGARLSFTVVPADPGTMLRRYATSHAASDTCLSDAGGLNVTCGPSFEGGAWVSSRGILPRVLLEYQAEPVPPASQTTMQKFVAFAKSNAFALAGVAAGLVVVFALGCCCYAARSRPK